MASRILIVDDEDSLRLLMELTLRDEGYEVRTAGHGLEALRVLAVWPADLVFLDLDMPVMDGLTFSEIYRSLPGPHAPLIAFTVGSPPANFVWDGLLPKPFELDDALELARCLAGRSRGRQTSEVSEPSEVSVCPTLITA